MKKLTPWFILFFVLLMLVINLRENAVDPQLLETNRKGFYDLSFLDNHFTYWYALLLTIIPVFILGFLPSVRFQRFWKWVLPSILLIAIPYLIWDHFFTSWGVWGFNEGRYNGPLIFEMPLEEILFFIFIPYACFLIYVGLKETTAVTLRGIEWFNLLFGLSGLVIAFFHWQEAYTFSTFLIQSGICFYFSFAKPAYLSDLYLSIIVSIIPFLLINGILTGFFTSSPVVVYNSEEYLGWRVGSIPINDFSYQFGLMALNIFCYESLKSLKKSPIN